jgi:hypothetical protein
VLELQDILLGVEKDATPRVLEIGRTLSFPSSFHPCVDLPSFFTYTLADSTRRIEDIQ